MGIVFTRAGWTGADIEFDHADGIETYAVAGDTLNAYEVASALRDWLDDAGRAWSASIDSVTMTAEPDDDDRRIRFVYTFTGADTAFTITPNATWTALFGDTSGSPVTACSASCAARPGSLVWERFDTESGGRSRVGAWRFGHQATSLRRPQVAVELTRQQSFALNEARRLATQPRTAYILDELVGGWRRVTVGNIDLMHPDDPTIVVGSIEVLGGDTLYAGAAAGVV
jgi:hypothetical protein